MSGNRGPATDEHERLWKMIGGQLAVSDQPRASDDERCFRGLFQVSDPNGVSPQKVLNLGCPVVCSSQVGPPLAAHGEVEKIGISGYNGESIGPCIFPDTFVRCVPRQTGVEHVRRIRKELRKAAYELRREIRVEQKLQRDTRCRPACEA